MTGSDVLLTVAELAVAFAGFASIVVLFQHRDPSRWPAAVPVRLRAMVESSLGTLYGALMPFPLHAIGLEGETLWATSSAAVIVALVVVGIVFYRRASPHLPSGELSRRFTLTIAAFTALVVLIQLGNAIGFPFGSGFGLYLIAVLWALLVASIMFLRMVVRPILPGGADDGVEADTPEGD